jgi:hypothetical protein
MKKLKAIFIDANRNLISDIEIDDHFEEINKAIGCDIFTQGMRLETGDIMYVDDMGWLDQRVTRAFGFGENVFAGNAVILGINRSSGESRDVKAKSLDVAADVQFAPVGWTISKEMRAQILAGTHVIPLVS